MNEYLTTTSPSEQGYYWLEVRDVTQIVKVVLRNEKLFIEYGQFFIPIEHYDGIGAQWAGPIPAPRRVTAAPQYDEVILLRDEDGLERFAFVPRNTSGYITKTGTLFINSRETTRNGVRIFHERNEIQL